MTYFGILVLFRGLSPTFRSLNRPSSGWALPLVSRFSTEIRGGAKLGLGAPCHPLPSQPITTCPATAWIKIKILEGLTFTKPHRCKLTGFDSCRGIARGESDRYVLGWEGRKKGHCSLGRNDGNRAADNGWLANCCPPRYKSQCRPNHATSPDPARCRMRPWTPTARRSAHHFATAPPPLSRSNGPEVGLNRSPVMCQVVSLVPAPPSPLGRKMDRANMSVAEGSQSHVVLTRETRHLVSSGCGDGPLRTGCPRGPPRGRARMGKREREGLATLCRTTSPSPCRILYVIHSQGVIDKTPGSRDSRILSQRFSLPGYFSVVVSQGLEGFAPNPITPSPSPDSLIFPSFSPLKSDTSGR